MAALQAGELNGVDCSGLYHDVNRILNTYTNKTIHTNITKAEHLALENLRKDEDHIIITADKGVALVVMDKTEHITKCEALLQDHSIYQHLSKDTSPTIHYKLSIPKFLLAPVSAMSARSLQKKSSSFWNSL